MVPEIYSAKGRVFSHFGQFLPLTLLTTQKIKILKFWHYHFHMSIINENHMMYDSWDMEHNRQNFFSFWTIFCPLHSFPPNNQENQNFEKMKETPGDIIILHKCTINDNHTVYGSWDMNCTRQNSFFTLGYPPNSLKKKIQKNEKKKKMPGDTIILHKCTKNHDHLLYCSWDMVRDGCKCYFSFWAILFPFTTLIAQKMKISKKWKKHLDISSFYTTVPKIMIICYTVPEIWHVADVIVISYLRQFFALLLPNSSKN